MTTTKEQNESASQGNGHFLIECGRETDRDTLAVILVRNEYTVRHHRKKKGNSNGYIHYIEYWKEASK